MRVRQGRDTMLVAGVPRERGAPVHFEHPDETAITYFDSGKVTEIHTPRHNPLVRIHELLHARHTDPRRYKRDFGKLPNHVGQLLEDVRMHTRFWPWSYGRTPQSVKLAIDSYLIAENERLQDGIAEERFGLGEWPDFAMRLRMAAVTGALHGHFDNAADNVGFAPGQNELAEAILRLIRSNNPKSIKKAVMLVLAAFPDLVPKPPFRMSGSSGNGKGGHIPDKDVPFIGMDGFEQPEMEIIEMPHTEHVEGASIGERRATMGSRLYRPALRRPLLPQRLFVRRTPQEPGGTILIDASGSMGDMANIGRWLEHAPFGTIACYAGNGSSGWLWVYAREGRRAKDLPDPPTRGNTVDGPALTWLMQQPGPRIMVTDREFCDAADSCAQIARLAQLEGAGELIVKNYNEEEEI